MRIYLELLHKLLEEGVLSNNRTNVPTLSICGYCMRFNLQEGFPLVTTKKVFTKGIILELLWFLKGNKNIKTLQDNNVNIWNDWADETGNIGPMYGEQWINWNNRNINQIDNALSLLRNNPTSRRILVTTWNPELIPSDDGEPRLNPPKGLMALAPCHAFFQLLVKNKKLTCIMYQRSVDVFLGLPFNIASYALLTHIFAQQSDLEVGDFVWMGGDVHLYHNHIQQAQIQLGRTPYPLPTLHILRKPPSIYDYQYSDFEILNYKCHPILKGKIAV